MSFLGIDIGSSSVKAVAFAADGRELASANQSYAFTVPEPGAMELDSRTVLAAAFDVIAECALAVAKVDRVEALAISSQGEAFTPLDAADRILAPAMISGDSRASRVMEAFAAQFGRERIYEITGHTPSAMFSLAKLLYLAENKKDVWSAAVKFLCFEDLLVHALCGEAAMGWPLAGRTLLFDVRRHGWSSELLAAAGLREEQFAKPLPCGSVVGTVLAERAARLGLSPDVQVVTGGHDQVIGAYGCGATVPGTAMYAAGSVEAFVPVFDRLSMSNELYCNNLCTYDFAEEGKYASIAYSLTGSNLLGYFMKTFAKDLQNDYDALLAEMPTEPTGLLALPYFTPSGTPYFDERTPACLYGWRFGMGRGEVLKGLEEGIALEMKLNMVLLKNSGVSINQLIATGGGFRNPAMVQLRADVLNLPISLVKIKEAGCHGAASLACRAVTGTPLAPPPIVAEVQPNAERAALYERKFDAYQKFSACIRKSL